MGARPKKATRITVSVETEDYRGLTQIAEDNDVSVAWVIRRAIAEYLQKHRDALAGQLPLTFEERQVQQ